MIKPRISQALQLLQEEKNLAADAALLDALPLIEEELRPEVLRIILHRRNSNTLRNLAGLYSELDPKTQAILIENVGQLFAGIRACIMSGTIEHRKSAIDLIEQSGAIKLAYLLSTAVKSNCPQTRDYAAHALRGMTKRLLQWRNEGAKGEEAYVLAKQMKDLAEALTDAIKAWEVHLQPIILEACLWMSPHIDNEIIEKLENPRSHIGRTISGYIAGGMDPRLAAFTLRALNLEKVRKTASQAIGETEHEDFILALARESWVLTDVKLKKSCTRIRDMRWLDNNISKLESFPKKQAAGLIMLIGLSGIHPNKKSTFFEQILSMPDESLQMAAIWQLISEKYDWSTELLYTASCRCATQPARMAKRELMKRNGESIHSSSVKPVRKKQADIQNSIEHNNEEEVTFEHLWNHIDDMSLIERIQFAKKLVEKHIDILDHIQKKLGSDQSANRIRALKIAKNLKLIPILSDTLFTLANDQDPVVRSIVATLLPDIPGLASEKIIIRLLRDQDTRVRANAIESASIMKIPNIIRHTHELANDDNPRARANAIKVLLEQDYPKAKDSILDMLTDQSSPHRISALWVVERLNLENIISQVKILAEHDPDERVKKRALRVLRTYNQSLTGSRRKSVSQPGLKPRTVSAGDDI